jgi:hypothetical protein
MGRAGKKAAKLIERHEAGEDVSPELASVAPVRAWVAYERGMAALRSWKADQAVDPFTACIVVHDDVGLEARCHRGLAVAAARSGDNARAYQEYSTYLELEPTAFDAGALKELLRSFAP